MKFYGKEMAVYISGEMTGKDKWNFPLFNQMSTALFVGLENQGYEEIKIINPAALSMEVGTLRNRVNYLARDLFEVSKCDVIVMLDGWKNSEGACIEHDFADYMKKVIISTNGGISNAYGKIEDYQNFYKTIQNILAGVMTENKIGV